MKSSTSASGTFTIQVEKRRRVPLSDGRPGFTTVHEGYVSYSVGVCVDLEAIAKELGPKAVQSKGGRSVLHRGLVVVERLQRTAERAS